MSNGYYITVDGRLSAAGTLADDGDLTGNYSNGFYGMIIIEADLGDTISVWGGYSTESCCDVISIFDGRMGSGTQLGTWRGEGSLSVVSYTGYLTVLFSTDGSDPRLAATMSLRSMPVRWEPHGWSLSGPPMTRAPII